MFEGIPVLSSREKALPMLLKRTLQATFPKKNSEVHSGNDKEADINIPGIMTNKTASG